MKNAHVDIPGLSEEEKDLLTYTSEYYENLLVLHLRSPPTAALCWQQHYQEADAQGIQPGAQRLVRKLAESLPFFTRAEMAACLDILQERGIPLDARDERGRTPLMHAFSLNPWRCDSWRWRANFEENSELWLEAGASLTATDHEGNTFLHLAGEQLLQENRLVQVIDAYSISILFLLEHGANVLACNQRGIAAHEEVEQRLFIETPHLLQKQWRECIETLKGTVEDVARRQTLHQALQHALSLPAPQKRGGRPRV